MSSARRAYDLLRAYVQREWDRIHPLEYEEALRELKAPSPPPPREERPSTHEDPRVLARRILGVSEEAGFEEVRKAFERLDRRSDPAKFPAGSPEREKAAEIRRKVHWAYRVLSENVPPVEKRFKSLEIE